MQIRNQKQQIKTYNIEGGLKKLFGIFANLTVESTHHEGKLEKKEFIILQFLLKKDLEGESEVEAMDIFEQSKKELNSKNPADNNFQLFEPILHYMISKGTIFLSRIENLGEYRSNTYYGITKSGKGKRIQANQDLEHSRDNLTKTQSAF
jgi:hypothetical protein